MSTRTAYIKTKQEILINKNFTVTFNTMVEHIENIKNEKNTDNKYVKYENLSYIFLTYTKNSAKFVIQMLNDDENIDPASLKIYSYEKASENKSNTKYIIEILKDKKKINNVKKTDIPLLIKLIKKYSDNNGKNSFFKKSKDECIQEIALTINSEFNAKKIYTMWVNRLNYYNKNISLKEIEEYREDDSKLIELKFKSFLLNLNSTNEAVADLIESYKYIFFDNHKKIFKLYDALSNINLDDDNKFYKLDIKEENANNLELREKYFHNYINETEELHFRLDIAQNPEIYEHMDQMQQHFMEEIGISQDDLDEVSTILNQHRDPNESEYSVEHYQRFDDENFIRNENDYYDPHIKLNKLIKNTNQEYSKEDVEFMKSYLENIIEKMDESYKNHYALLMVDKSSSLILNLVDLFYEYFEIKIFKKINNYKKTSTMIKKYYKFKLENFKKYKNVYNEYLHNYDLRAKKIIEIEFLDKFIVENKQVIQNIFHIDANANTHYDIHFLMDALENKIFSKYHSDVVMLEKQLSKLDKVEYLYYLLNGINVDVNEPRRIVSRSSYITELFCKHRYENQIYLKYKYPKYILDLTFEDFENGFEENIPTKEYFVKKNLK
ncbi:hypothetical protein L5F09_10070 [Aliarcobacter butzleri]|uniref:hypothetical protein n=1 Tax=Aliarcobacter butzleri TaxID=28197 RepID=UPI001EDA7967|nr:hypothetical protein [Aliarcobacter butzleri]MCG3666100.1 hypothetical protein [Aliarcobacter butzleri]